jgi:peptidyl-prolyl cis-trans isomerase D
MIFWMQNVLEKHLKWLFIVLLMIIIVSFVFTIGPSVGIGDPYQKIKQHNFYGFKLDDPAVVEHLQKGAMMWFMLGNEPLSIQFSLESLLFPRAVLLHWADEYQVPNPTLKVLGGYIRKQKLFLDEAGNFDAQKYERWRAQMHSESEMAEIFAENWRMQCVLDALNGPGYALVEEAVQELQLMGTKWTLQVATMSYEQFNPKIEETPELLQEYYNDHAFAYTQPEQVELSYIKFPSNAYLAQVKEPSEDVLREHFEVYQAIFLPKGSDNVSFDSVKEAVKKDWVRQQAIELAGEDANAFVYELYEHKVTAHSEDLKKMLAVHNLSTVPIPAYSAQSLPNDTLFRSQDLKRGLMLDDEAYMSDPLPIADGVGILLYERRIASHVLPYEQVKTQVTLDYRANQKKRLFSEWGKATHQQIVDGLIKGISFEDVAKSIGLKVQTEPAFTLEDAPKSISPNVLESILPMREGQVSPMKTTEAAGSFVFLAKKEVPKFNPNDSKVAERLAEIEHMTAIVTALEVIQESVEKELQSFEVEDASKD